MHDALIVIKHVAYAWSLVQNKTFLVQLSIFGRLQASSNCNHCTCRVVSQVSLRLLMARLDLRHVSQDEGELQQQAYLGNNEQLLQHMRDRGITTMTTKSVRSWLEKNGGFPLGYQDANLCLADCDIDHILPNSVGGQNHPYNYVLLPKRLNSSFNGWWTAQKQVYIGKKTAKTAKNFFIWVREEGRRLGLDCNDFHQMRYSM